MSKYMSEGAEPEGRLNYGFNKKGPGQAAKKNHVQYSIGPCPTRH
jgi:hypothetical protein